jgi:hypothetical protein
MSIFLCLRCITHILGLTHIIGAGFTEYEKEEYKCKRRASKPELCVRCSQIVQKAQAAKLKKCDGRCAIIVKKVMLKK